jgi:sarcosine oxidase subunit beta
MKAHSPTRADVVIVGGGLMGATTAFFLRRRGVSVALVERGLVGQQASGVNFGHVRRQGRFLPQLPLAHRSREIWGKLPSIIGEDVEFMASGSVRVAYDDAQLADFEQYARDAKSWGLELEILGRAAIHRQFPFFGADVVGGSSSPNDGHANPRLAAPAFARAAKRLGAKVFENEHVSNIQKDARDFVVSTETGLVVHAPIALVCAGAWAGKMAAAFGEPVPISPKGPTMGVTEPLPYAIPPVVSVSSKLVDEGVYFRQVKRGNLVFGGGPRNPAFLDERRARVTPGFTINQVKQLVRLAPGLRNAHVLRTWSGVEGYLDDDIPIMGASHKVSGLYYAFGFCGHGFQLGPGVGDVLAELIATGSTSTNIDPFSIRRFAHGEQRTVSEVHADE